MKNNKALMRGLIVAVIAVWAAIGYQIVTAISSGDSEIAGVNVGKSTGVQETQYVYLGDVRDPFRMIPVHKTTSQKSHQRAMKDTTFVPTPLKLSGIMTKGKINVAIVEGAGGNIFFLHKGDTLSGVRVIKIDTRTVSYIFGKQKRYWNLEESIVSLRP